MSDLLNRIGIINVSTVLLRDNPEGLLKIFKDVLVTDVNIKPAGASDYILIYRGLSKYFDLIKDGEEIPIYNIIINTKDGEIDSYRFIRIYEKNISRIGANCMI